MERLDELEQLTQRKRMPAKLVFDTAGRSIAAGARRRESSSRHLLYEIADLCLDLRLDQKPQTNTATVVGQLADRKDPLKPLAGLKVYLKAGERFLAQTTSNRLGEFQVQCEPETAMRLCLPIGDQDLIEVPVNPCIDGHIEN